MYGVKENFSTVAQRCHDLYQVYQKVIDKEVAKKLGNLSSSLTSFIQTLKDENGGMLFLRFDRGKVFWLSGHHKWLDPEDGRPVLLGLGQPDKKFCRDSNRIRQAKVLYLYE